MAGNFRDLIIWQNGYRLSMEIRKLTSKYPREERFGLTDQTNRSSNSVIALIAEAHGRYFYKDKTRVLYESRGEVEETRSHLSVAVGLKYITLEEFNKFDIEYEQLEKSISSYINSIHKDV